MNELPRVGYFYSYFPKEILYAFGRVPIRIFPRAHDGANAEPYLHKNFCALLKVTLSRFLEDSTADDLEGVIFSDICDGQRRLYDVWHAYVQVPTLAFLDLPRRADMLGQEFYAAALARLVVKLEEQFARALTADALADSIRLHNRQRALWNDLRTAWAMGHLPAATYYTLQDVRFTRDPVTANAEIERALNSTRPLAEGGEGPRVLVMGSLQVHRGLVDALEEAGARVVAEDSACDERELSAAVREQGTRDELIRALAVQYLDAPAPRLRDLTRRLTYLGRLAATRRVQGVICSYYKFCDLFLAEFPIVKKFFQDKGIPVLLIEDEGEATFSSQARTRVEAFVEMLR